MDKILFSESASNFNFAYYPINIDQSVYYSKLEMLKNLFQETSIKSDKN